MRVLGEERNRRQGIEVGKNENVKKREGEKEGNASE